MLPLYTKRVYDASVKNTDRIWTAHLRVSSLGGMNEKNYKKQTGIRMKAAREAAQLTQQQAVDHLSILKGSAIPASRVGNYEQGKRLPDPVTLLQLCALYGSSPSAIYGFTDVPQGSDENALMKKYRSTDDRGKRAIQGIADAQPSHDLKAEQPGGAKRA